MRKPVRERPVVRQQQRAGRVSVEAPDRHDPFGHVHELHDRGTSLRIARGRDCSGRLVQQDIPQLLQGERIITDAGGSLVGVYVTLGRYDVVEVFEAPDDNVAIEILMKLNQYGAEHTETLRAFTRDEAEEIIRKL